MGEQTIIRIDLKSPIPAYQQIGDAIRACLVEGQVRPGDRLPVVRELAADLGVHHNTVAEAYRQLAEEGWLELRRGRGATVRDRRQPKPKAGAEERFQQRMRELVAKALSEGLQRALIAAKLRALSRQLMGVER